MKCRAGAGLAAAVFAGGVILAAPASASLFCEVNKTPDGFVALRTKPDRAAKLVARAKAGDEFLIDGGVERKNNWQYVTWWKGGRFKKQHPGGGYDRPDAKGWVHSSLLGECG